MANPDVTLLLRAGALLLQRHPEEYWKWNQYAAAAELLSKHDRGEANLYALPSCKNLVEGILGHPIDQPPPTDLDEVIERALHVALTTERKR